MKRHLFRRMGRFLRPQASSLSRGCGAGRSVRSAGAAGASRGGLGGGGHRDWAGGLRT